ncbi:hypothetical protein COI_2045 [Mannheimia haemolytica serotype A2 str. OVINE]|nr:hypothetical protein COI_2045 [Mannheimia haemolytica serotype A2 str. OVINE]EEY13385.1 hypothetical protein COK_0526 [Mannheimia haemolytica serotype A2 str. BOVINE]
MLPSLLFRSTVSLGLTLLLFCPSLIVKFQPAFAISCTVYNWLPLTASVEVLFTSPAFTLVIFVGLPS